MAFVSYYPTSLADSPAGASSIVTAVVWLQDILLGPVATSIAVLAVAAIDFGMLTGRIDIRHCVTVVMGCFTLFGALSIVAQRWKPHIWETRRLRMSPASIGLNPFHHIRAVSWQMSMPRSNSRSSTFRNDSGNRTYIITTKRITSGDELNRRNGRGGLARDSWLTRARYHPPRWSARAQRLNSDC